MTFVWSLRADLRVMTATAIRQLPSTYCKVRSCQLMSGTCRPRQGAAVVLKPRYSCAFCFYRPLSPLGGVESAVVLTTRMTSCRLLPLSSRVLNIRAGCFERPTSAPLSFSMPEEEDRYRQRNEIYPGDLVFFR